MGRRTAERQRDAVKQREGRRASRVLGAAIGVQFFSGILYVWSIFKDHLIARYQWTDAEATIPYTIANIVFALSMFMAGLILPKTSARLMITVGTGMLGLGLVLSAFATTPWMWVITMGLIVSAGIGINNLVATPAAICWYPPSRRGSIIGLVVAGVAIAPVMYSPLASYLFTTIGLTRGSIALGLLVFLIPLPLAQLIASPPEGFIPAGRSADKTTDSSNTEVSCRQMIRKPDFYKLFVMFAFSASAGLILFGHLTRIVRLQANWEGGFFLLMLLAVFNAAGRFMGGAASDRMSNAALLRLVFLGQAINFALFGFHRSPWTLGLGVAIAGICYGAILSVFPVLTADYFGTKHLGANYGLMFLAWGIGGVLGPQIAGSVFDATGSYQTAYWLAVALLIAASLVTFTLKEKKSTT